MADPVLEINNLKTHYTTQYGVVRAVSDLSLSVAAGEILGLVGESGCGKTTVGLSILRLLPEAGSIAAGEIKLRGQDLVPLSRRAMRAKRGKDVAMIFQDAQAALDPTMKVGDQIVEGLRIHLKRSAREAREEARALFQMVGIPSPEERLQDYPHQFSGGMQQRVMIAMAISCNPSVLLADEPTTALDVTVQRQILDLIVEMVERTRAGVILITHDVGVVAATCDRVAVMYAGRKVESGPTREVFTAPRHPYTIGLLNSTLKLDRRRGEMLDAIPGMPPSLIHPPRGCSFWPRCSFQSQRCKEATPVLEEVDTGHFVECWRNDQARTADHV